MAAFGLVFVPPMIGTNWKASLGIAVGIGLIAYLVAFELALVLDQPFGPTLVLLLVAFGAIGLALGG
jgi:zinc/manganese transport system permease protein